MFKESVTSAKIQTALKGLGVDYKVGYGRNIRTDRIEGAGCTGIIADIGTGKPPTVLLRADIDGLPIDESKVREGAGGLGRRTAWGWRACRKAGVKDG